MNIIVTFIALSLINVVFSTIRSITTIKSGKAVASLISGGYFAFYNIMLIYTVADFSMWQKCLITFVCNVIGVWVVKAIEEKREPVKMWKIEIAIPAARITNADMMKDTIEEAGIPCNYILLGKWIIFNCYCNTRKESDFMRDFCRQYEGKISAYESKNI